jgi:hypothetical protein
MSTPGFLIRYPNGEYEYSLTQRGIPSIGDHLRRKGSLWVVKHVNGNGNATVFVEPLRDPTMLDRQGSPSGQ